MLQRIQTLILIISLVVWALVGIFPMASVYDQVSVYHIQMDGIYQQTANGLELYSRLYSFIILYGIISLLQVITIFLYRRRMLQMRFCIYTVLLETGFLVLAFYYVFQTIPGDETASVSWRYPAIFPVCAAILNLIAYRYILKDERLIRSVDRIR